MYLKIFTLLITTFFMVAVNAQNVLKVQSGATLEVTGGAVITLQDINLDNDGTINLAPGDGTFVFTGTAPNTISGGGIPYFDMVQINKTGLGSLTLKRDINVEGSIQFTAGNINLNTFNIHLQPTALLTGENESSHITGTTGGFVEITNVLNAPSSANPGNLGAILSSSSNLGSTIIRRGHQSQTNSSGSGNSVLRYYDIIPTNNLALNTTLRLRYFDAELNGLSESALTLWKSPDNIAWTEEGFTDRNSSTNYVEKSGIANFSRWTLSSTGNALPVEFILFNVKCNDSKVEIIWKTATEQYSSYFEVQRSGDGRNWIPIGTVQAAGNSNEERRYGFTDTKPLSGTVFYRIAEIDMDNRAFYTGIIKNQCGQNNTLKAWPNPVHDKLWIDLNITEGSKVVIRVFDNKGAFVSEQYNVLPAGSNQLSIDFTRLTAGLYHVVAEWDNGNQKKVLKVVRE